MDYEALANILTEVATPILLVLVMAAVVIAFVWVVVRTAPIVQNILQELRDFTDAQTRSWERLQQAQEKLIENYEKQIGSYEKRISVLEGQVEKLIKELAEAQSEVKRLQGIEGKLKEVSAELDRVVRERDDLLKRMKAVEDGRLSEMPAKDDKPAKDSEAKAAA